MDKNHIPEELKYRDRGYMYFPSKELLTFLRGLDNKESANEATYRTYGPEMIDVAVKQLEATQEFLQQFMDLINKCLLQKHADIDVKV